MRMRRLGVKTGDVVIALVACNNTTLGTDVCIGSKGTVVGPSMCTGSDDALDRVRVEFVSVISGTPHSHFDMLTSQLEVRGLWRQPCPRHLRLNDHA